MSNSQTWSPLRFLTCGIFAESEDLKRLLEDVREATVSQCCLLLFHQLGEFYESILYVAHEDRDRQKDLQEILASKQFSDDDRQALYRILYENNDLGGSLEEILPIELRWGGFSDVAKEYSNARSKVLFPTLVATESWNASNKNPRMGILCVGIRFESNTTKIDELFTAVNATAQVYLRRLQSEMGHKMSDYLGKIENQIARPNRIASNDSTELTAIDEFLANLLKLSKANCGSIVMFDDQPNELAEIARVTLSSDGTPIRCPRGPITIVRGRITDGVISHVCLKTQPVLFNDRSEFELMHKRTKFRDFSSEWPSYANLAIPIIDQQRLKTVGVLNVERNFVDTREGTTEPNFTLFDFHLLDQASRLFLAAYSRGHARLVENILKREKKHIRPQPLFQEATVPEIYGDHWEKSSLPSDFARSSDQIQSLLDDVCVGLRFVNVCTVRVLSVDQKKLCLLAVFPKIDRNRIDHCVPLNGESPMAKVAINGKVMIGPGTDLPKRLNRLESYISIPLLIGSRCIGTVTFGSLFTEKKFLEFEKIILREITETVSEIFESYQTRFISMLLGKTAQVYKAFHELNKIPGRMTEQLDKMDVSNDSSFDRIRSDVGLLERSLRDYNEARDQRVQRNHAKDSYSVGELVDDALRDTEYRNYFRVLSHTKNQSLMISAHVFDICNEAFRDVLRNAVTHRTMYAMRKKPFISFRQRKLGGSWFAQIVVSNMLCEQLSWELRHKIHREPIRIPLRDRRWHYGAFLSGTLVRSVGGDIFLELPKDQLSVVLEIPHLVDAGNYTFRGRIS